MLVNWSESTKTDAMISMCRS